MPSSTRWSNTAGAASAHCPAPMHLSVSTETLRLTTEILSLSDSIVTQIQEPFAFDKKAKPLKLRQLQIIMKWTTGAMACSVFTEENTNEAPWHRPCGRWEELRPPRFPVGLKSRYPPGSPTAMGSPGRSQPGQSARSRRNCRSDVLFGRLKDRHALDMLGHRKDASQRHDKQNAWWEPCFSSFRRRVIRLDRSLDGLRSHLIW